MPFSNTAVPKYYKIFRDEVLKGTIPVNEYISMEMNRIDSLIKDPGVYYNGDIVEGFISFCENELTLVDGSDLHMLDTYKLWAEQVYGWWYYEERSVYQPSKNNHGGKYVQKKVLKRLTNKQFIILGRGGAKTLYNTCHHAYGLTVDTSTTSQISVSYTMRQAEETLGPLKTAIARSKGPLFRFLTEGSIQNTTGSKANRVKLSPTKKGIENLLTNSILEVCPMSIDKLQGFRHKYASVDEWLSCDIREDPIAAIEQGSSKIDDYLIIATSSEGNVRGSRGDTIKMELLSILKGEYFNPHVSIWWYKLDNIEEINDPSMWPKANPNIGKTVSYSTYQREVERAESNPSVRNEIIAKRFGIPLEGYTYFFTYEETKKHPRCTFWELPCSVGADLSLGDDFCAFTFFFPLRNEKYGIKTRCYITELTLSKLPRATRERYEDFINEGSLCVMDGAVLNIMAVYDDLDAYIDNNKYDPQCIGYDPYNAKDFIARWEAEHGPYGIVKVIQGSKTESVPLGELKKLSEIRKLVFDQELMSFGMQNCIALEDSNGNRKLSKKRREDKIDSVAAMMDAYIAYKANMELFE